MNTAFLTASGAPRPSAEPDEMDDATAPMATLRLHSDSLNPETLSQIIGHVSTAAAAKGGPLGRTGDGRPVLARTGTWYLDTLGRPGTERSETDRPDAHLRRLIDVVSTHMDPLRSAIPDIAVEVSLMLTGSGPAAMAAINECGEALPATIERACTPGTVSVEIPSEAYRQQYGTGFRFPEPPAPAPIPATPG